MATVLNDRLFFNDNKSDKVILPNLSSNGFWARTEVMGSYDDIELDQNGVFSTFVKKIPTGISSLGEKIFRTEKTKPLWTKSNMVPIGGCQFAMEMLFGVKSTQFSIPTINALSHIGLSDSSLPTETYDIPGGTKNAIYRYGNFVQLFGIGMTGEENDTTVHPVNYRENSIDMTGQITGTMIPFRFTSDSLKDTDKLNYFGKKNDEVNGISGTSYYLKRFEKDPTIKHIWKTGEEFEEEQLISPSDVWTNITNTNSVTSFTEFILKITKDDVKEWFNARGQGDSAHINTIALFTGQYVKNPDGSIGDYRDVRLFSKLNIPVEYLSLSKDLNLVYRVYTA